MNDYPRLTDMGVRNPLQISQYLVNSIANFDVLRIVYVRRKGSLLPTSHTYKFPRIQKELVMDGKPETVMETDPALRAAVSELQHLLKEKEQKENVAESILEELRLLEEDIALRSACIEDLVKRLN